MIDPQVIAFAGIAALLTITPGADTMMICLEYGSLLNIGRKDPLGSEPADELSLTRLQIIVKDSFGAGAGDLLIDTEDKTKRKEENNGH